MRGFNPFQWFARELDAAEPGILDAPQLEDATPIPPPSELLVSDALQIASLRYQLNNANAHVARLQGQLLARRAVPAADRHCPNCAGLAQTVELLRGERGELRGQLAAYRIQATRHQQLRPVTNAEQLP